MEGGAIRSGRVISKLESQKCEVKAQRGACMIANKEYMLLHGCAYMHVYLETAMNIKQTTLAAALALLSLGSSGKLEPLDRFCQRASCPVSGSTRMELGRRNG